MLPTVGGIALTVPHRTRCISSESDEFAGCIICVLCKLWDDCGICDILWTIFADDGKLV
jgi:hypothetical protein